MKLALPMADVFFSIEVKNLLKQKPMLINSQNNNELIVFYLCANCTNLSRIYSKIKCYSCYQFILELRVESVQNRSKVKQGNAFVWLPVKSPLFSSRA